MKFAVIGSGGWGTALALILVENGHEVTLWSHTPAKTEILRTKKENPMLKEVILPDAMQFTSDLSVVKDCDAVVMATPSYAVRETAQKLRGLVQPGTILISTSKGIERGTSLRLSQVIEQELEHICPVVVLSGPSHAEEVGRHIPTGVVAAADQLKDAEFVQDIFMNPRFRVYTSNDRIGTEICAALKNVIALSAGCCDGLGCGDNTKALLMTRGLAEIARLGVALGGKKESAYTRIYVFFYKVNCGFGNDLKALFQSFRLLLHVKQYPVSGHFSCSRQRAEYCLYERYLSLCKL